MARTTGPATPKTVIAAQRAVLCNSFTLRHGPEVGSAGAEVCGENAGQELRAAVARSAIASQSFETLLGSACFWIVQDSLVRFS